MFIFFFVQGFSLSGHNGGNQGVGDTHNITVTGIDEIIGGRVAHWLGATPRAIQGVHRILGIGWNEWIFGNNGNSSNHLGHNFVLLHQIGFRGREGS